MTSRQAGDRSLDIPNLTGRDETDEIAGEDPWWCLNAAVTELTRMEGGTGSLAGFRTESFTVAPDPEAVTDARHFTTTMLRSWGLDPLCDDIGLVVTELVTNALRHSLPPRAAETPQTIWLRLMRRSSYVLCGVVDAGQGVPQRREPDFIAESGRGLHLVDSFSRRWGWQGMACGRKVVWALFTVPR